MWGTTQGRSWPRLAGCFSFNCETGHGSHREAQLMKGKSSHPTYPWTQFHRGLEQYNEDSSVSRPWLLPGSTSCSPARHKGWLPAFLSPSSDGSCSHLQSGSCLGPKETRVCGSIYESTTPSNAICSSKLSAVPLLGTGHLMPLDAEPQSKVSCREIPTQTTL